jgi:aldehyde dehydrogenase (NAD+)
VTTTESSTSADAAATVAALRQTFESGRTRPLESRQRQLARLDELLVNEEGALLDALRADLGKPAIEGWVTDVSLVRNEIKALRKHLAKWTGPQKVRVGVTNQPGKGRIDRRCDNVAATRGSPTLVVWARALDRVVSEDG